MANRIKPTPAPTSTSGYYEKTEWQTGDVITRPKMMNIEDWLASANDELMLARTGYTTNNREDWTKYQFATIGERIDDIVEYVRKIVSLSDIDEIIKIIDVYIARVKEESESAVDNINDYDATVLQNANTASSNIANYDNSVLAKANAAKTTIDNRTTEVNTKADQAISNINGYDSSVSQAANTAKTNISQYDADTLAKSNTAKTTIDGYVSSVNTYANNTNGKGKKEIDSLVSQVTASKNAAITSITNDKNSVSSAKTSAETTIAKYVDNETPATGETEGVKQISEQAIEEIEDLIEQTKRAVTEDGIYPVTDSFTIPVASWTGTGPFVYNTNAYSSINEEYDIIVTLDKTSYFNLNASLEAAINSNGKVTFTTDKKPSGSIDVKIILQKVEAM